MKQRIKTTAVALLLSLITFGAFAQDDNSTAASPRWASDKGYWVVESNIHTPMNSIIRFYNNDDVLVYTEKLNGVKMDPDKRKVKMKLKRVLESSVIAWEKRGRPEEDGTLVKAILK